WRASPPADLVYAAGSTGSMPATAELLAVVAALPKGAVILPGLDHDLDDASWAAAAAEPTHPQYGLAMLLATLGLAREMVAPWPDAVPLPAGAARARLVAEALRPAETTDAWLHLPLPADAAFAGLRRLDCAGVQEEAGAIALLLREALESDGKTAALVTPDRDLARRVVAELGRWNITIDDSAGPPLARTAPGGFFRLVAEMMTEEAAPVPLLAVLKHPLAAGGMERGAFLRLVRRLERRALRGPRPAPGFDGLAHAVAACKDAALLMPWIERLAAAAAPLAAAMTRRETPLAAILDAHVGFAEWFAASGEGDAENPLWAGDAGEALADFVGELRLAAPALGGIDGKGWPGLLDTLLAGRVVRPRRERHPRLAIWGPLEARLQRADLVILGGLNEGTWPPEPQEDPWLSRPMRATLGLPPHERRIGLSAHDFAQGFAAPEVVLTRAGKVEGAPTVPSRWLLRLDAMLARDARWHDIRRAEYADWHRRLDAPAMVRPVAPPRPCPPVAARPRALSVTRIETWIRDPYAIFAQYILSLKPLEPLDADPGALERGAMIHEALDRFVRDHRAALPGDALARLLVAGEDAFRPWLDRPAVRAFWWPRFCRIAEWFVEFEIARRADGTRPLATEITGRMTVAAPAGPFVLSGKADRIDALPDRSLAIIDYKTGVPPTGPQVTSGLSPQLPLEAAIARAGGFPGIVATTVAVLAYIRLKGGAPVAEYKAVVAERDGRVLSPDMLAAEAEAGLRRRIARFDVADTPYLSRPRPQWLAYAGEYDHLARVREWSSAFGRDGG
ncbi:MAG: double-strand break repair protein AddB, partial [Rhodospirillales bacterium]|nr:double-strand break repair protein AddB [Rhodospirillales bacterium]